jgi:hypothetical protein
VRGDSFATRLRRLPLTAQASPSRALPQGESGEFVACVIIRHANSLPRRACASGSCSFLSLILRRAEGPSRRTGGWRAERRKPMAPCSLLNTAGASRRATCAHFGALPRFALLERMAQLRQIKRMLICGVLTPASGLASVRPVARLGAGRALSQLLAGTPSGPGRSSDAARVHGLRSRTRGHRTSSRLRKRLAKRPSKGRGGRSVRQVLGPGISFSSGTPLSATCNALVSHRGPGLGRDGCQPSGCPH